MTRSTSGIPPVVTASGSRLVSRVARGAGWTAAVAGLVLVAGCGDAGGRPTRSAAVPSTQAPFGQDTVRRELEAAVVAAGLPGGETEAGYPKPRHSAGAAATEKERKVAALADRLSPCVVTWSSDDATGASEATAAKARRQFAAMLADLGAHGWKEAAPTNDVPTNGSVYVMSTYKKRGWILNARHSSMGPWVESTAMATKASCFDGLTDEETSVLEDVD